ncbi:MAG: hypothetical protein M0Q94_08020 [Candidatus Cloacimonetes bacterium]|nr:hypothetical protein [Candidatus Cloacimonadota bacterium]
MKEYDFKKPQIHIGFAIKKENTFDLMKKVLNCETLKTIEEKKLKIKIIWFFIGNDKTIFEAKIYDNKFDCSNFHIGINVKNIYKRHELHKQRINNIGSKKIKIGEIFYYKTFANYFLIFDKQVTFEIIEYFTNAF